MIRKVTSKAKRIIHEAIVDDNAYYKTLFKDCPKFWNHKQFNLQVVNTGSNSALYGFDYEDTGVLGANWAMGPQSLHQDLAILKTYFSFVRPRGTILVPLCPYSSCLKNYKDTEELKYYTVVHPGAMWKNDENEVKHAFFLKNHPYRAARHEMISGLYRSLKQALQSHKRPETLDYQPMNHLQLKQNAQRFIDSWKRQFKIDDMNAPCPPHILKGSVQRVDTLRELLQFCRDRELEYYVVLPPVTSYLSCYFSKEFMEHYVFSFLEACGLEPDRMLNYLTDADLQDESLYFNSYFLNAKGRKVFTRRVLKDVGLLPNEDRYTHSSVQ
jgi:hypothetical protein